MDRVHALRATSFRLDVVSVSSYTGSKDNYQIIFGPKRGRRSIAQWEPIRKERDRARKSRDVMYVKPEDKEEYLRCSTTAKENFS